MLSQDVPNDRLLLNISEVASLLAIGRNLTYELVRTGNLPHVRLGRRVLIPRDALLAWIQSEVRPRREG